MHIHSLLQFAQHNGNKFCVWAVRPSCRFCRHFVSLQTLIFYFDCPFVVNFARLLGGIFTIIGQVVQFIMMLRNSDTNRRKKPIHKTRE